MGSGAKLIRPDGAGEKNQRLTEELAATVQIQVGARAGQPTCKAQLEVR